MSKEKFLEEVNRQKGTKTNLKAHKVMLSDIDNIREFLDMSYLEDMIEEIFQLSPELKQEIKYTISKELRV